MLEPKASLSGAGSSAPLFSATPQKQITHNTQTGGGEVAGQQVMTAKPEEQTVTGHGAGTLVKSPSTPAPGVSYLSSEIGPLEVEYLRLEIEAAGKERDAIKRYEDTQRALMDEARNTMMSALRRECERTREAETKAQYCRAVALSERHMRVMLMWWVGGYASVVTVLAGWALARVWGWLQ